MTTTEIELAKALFTKIQNPSEVVFKSVAAAAFPKKPL